MISKGKLTWLLKGWSFRDRYFGSCDGQFFLSREHRNMVGNYEIKRSRFFHLGNRREMSSRIKSDWVEKPSSVAGVEFSTRINC